MTVHVDTLMVTGAYCRLSTVVYSLPYGKSALHTVYSDPVLKKSLINLTSTTAALHPSYICLTRIRGGFPLPSRGTDVPTCFLSVLGSSDPVSTHTIPPTPQPPS